MEPRFTVVVPTRDRPDLLAFCLESLASQTFDDVEVIVADNAGRARADRVFERWARPGWRYLTSERPLAMHDNFELGCSQATGEYVAVAIDKTVLHPSALQQADEVLAPGVDIVTWRNEGYDPLDERHEVGPGLFRPAAAPIGPAPYDPREELARRFAFAERRGADPVHYVRGKIAFGVFSRRLLDRIRSQAGRVFHPLAPDYTSMVPGCVLADGAVDLGRPLLVSYNSYTSNGRRQAKDPAHARRFIEAADRAIVDRLPVAGLYSSQHNAVAYDLVSSAARCPAGSTPPLDMPNLLRRAREDLEAVVWRDDDERAAQYALLEAAEAARGVDPAAASAVKAPPRSLRARAGALAAHVPVLERFVQLEEERQIYPSPVAAAQVADRHYASTVAA